eukprot:6989809-Prymnesium_polylepis.2
MAWHKRPFERYGSPNSIDRFTDEFAHACTLHSALSTMALSTMALSRAHWAWTSIRAAPSSQEGFCDMLVLGISAFKHVVATHEAMLNSLDQIEEALAQNWIEPSPKMRKSRICSRLCHSTSLDKGSGLCSRIKGVLRDGSSVSTCSRSSSAKKVFSETADDSDREDGDSR